jgi:2-hydroxy-3-keto-5-methylthiopentenyl-1-phosphate phosphatase
LVKDNQKSIEENRNLINQYRSIKEDVRDDLGKMPEHMKHCRDILIEMVKNEIRNEMRNK